MEKVNLLKIAEIPEDLQSQMNSTIHPIMEKWVEGKKLKLSKIYGMRRYLNGGYIANHHDKFGKFKEV